MTLDDLLPRIAALLQYGGHWYARPVDSNEFQQAGTALDAVRRALGLVTDEPPDADLF